jgi:hypothetical protein
VQLGPIVRPLPFPRPRAASYSYSYISSFLLLHPPSHCTALHRTAPHRAPRKSTHPAVFKLLSHLAFGLVGLWACGLFLCTSSHHLCQHRLTTDD